MISPKNFERLVVMVSWIHHSPIAPVELSPSMGMKISIEVPILFQAQKFPWVWFIGV